VRVTVAVEVVLGLAVLFVAPLLGGSARNQAFQASPAALAQTASVGSARVTLTPSGEQPGPIDYQIAVRGETPDTVAVTFTAPQSPGGQTIIADALGHDRYRVAAFPTPTTGTWKIAVRLDGGSPASFALPISTKPGKLPKAPAPKITASTWLFGIGETLLVVLVLVSSARVSRRLRARRSSDAPLTPPTDQPRPDLVDA
jgi:hypothetical protein